MKKAPGRESHSLLLIVIIMLVAMSIIQLFITFRGLNDPMAMDQAQIGRQVARGEGMTTKFIRPMALSKSWDKAKSNAAKETAKEREEAHKAGLPTEGIKVPVAFNAHRMEDTNNAPLNILADAVALKLSGASKFDDWRMQDNTLIYAADRVIAAVSSVFFILSVLTIFLLIRRMFDNIVAGITCVLLILSDLFIRFSISGLPQMMMLFFFSLGIYFLYGAIERQNNKKNPLTLLALCGLSFSLLCLSGWIGIWPLIGLLIFVGIFFRPHGVYCIPIILIFAILSLWTILHYNNYSGNPFGIAVYSAYQGFVGDESLIMRALVQRDVPVNPQTIMTQLIGNSLRQVTLLYTNMGGIIVTPFFFLALLHPFKNQSTNMIKWAVLLIWIFATIGMSLYSDDEALTGSQLQVLATPLFTAFGLAILFVFVGRMMASHQVRGLRPFLIALVIVVSSGQLIMSLPREIKNGLVRESASWPHFPPYFPLSLNGKLHDASEPGKVIASDQPWAVAWYSDRSSLWLPRKKDDFFALEEILKENGTSVGGILITPTSQSVPGGIRGVKEYYGDFANLVTEGTMLLLHPSYSTYLTSASSRPPEKDPILSRFAHTRSRLYLFGAQIMYYSEAPVDNQ